MKGERGVKNLLMVSHSLDVKNLSDWWVNKRGGNSIIVPHNRQSAWWLGLAWHVVAWHGVAWHGVAWRGMAWSI